MKQKIFTLLSALLFMSSGAWATDFTFDVTTDFNDLTDAQKDALISNGIVSGDKLINISFSNPGTDFQRDGSGIKMRGAAARNATITISGGIVATISAVELTYSGTKRNIVSTPSVTRTDDDENNTMTWGFDNVSSLTLSQNVGNTVITKIKVTYASTGVALKYATWDFQNGNPSSLATEAIGIENKEANVTSSEATVSMHVNTKEGAAYEGVTGKLNYRSGNGDAQCNKGAIMQIPVKGSRDVVKLVPKSGGYKIAGGSEVTATTTYTATATDVAQGYVEIICSTSGYLYSITVTQYSASVGTKSERNYASYVTPEKLNFSSADGITAYIATGLNGGNDAVVLSSVDVVPAGTPIIVKTDTQGATVDVPVTSADASDVSGNKLVEGDGSAWNAVAGTTYYYLASDKFHEATSGNLKAGKAYLAIVSGGGAHELNIVFDDASGTTGIAELQNSKTAAQGTYYNLNGQRVNANHKGIVIVNGKKFMNK